MTTLNLFTPNLPSLVLIFSSLLITSNSLYAWANRHSTGFDHVMILAGNALWLFALGARLGTHNTEFYLELNRLITLSFCMMSLGLFRYTISFAGYDYWLGRRNLLLVSLIPLVGLFLFFTNSAHHLMWTDVRLYYVSGVTLSEINYQPGFYFIIFYDVMLILSSMFVFVRVSSNSTELQRKQMLILFDTSPSYLYQNHSQQGLSLAADIS